MLVIYSILTLHLITRLRFRRINWLWPLFDLCGDNCHTKMVNFCTVGRDLAQMTDR